MNRQRCFYHLNGGFLCGMGAYLNNIIVIYFALMGGYMFNIKCKVYFSSMFRMVLMLMLYLDVGCF